MDPPLVSSFELEEFQLNKGFEPLLAETLFLHAQQSRLALKCDQPECRMGQTRLPKHLD
jgi:hypothetical protein